MDRDYKDGDELPLITPGYVLMQEFMKPYNLSINELARQLSVAPTAISEIVRAQRAISTAMAARLSRFFGNSMQMWLNLQQSYEIEEFNRTSQPTAITEQVVPFDYIELVKYETSVRVSENTSEVSFRKTQAKKSVSSKKLPASSRSTAKAITKKAATSTGKKSKNR